MILFITSFVAGIFTILAPCTLPLLPVIIGSSVGDKDKKNNFKKALTIAVSLGASVILFTLLLKVSTLFINIPASTWSLISGIIILIFGLISLFPALWEKIPLVKKLNTSSNKMLGVGYQKKSFIGDVIIGASLGPVFSTCSPTYFIILATVLPQSFFFGFLYLITYAIGLSGVLLLVAYLGQKITSRLGSLSDTRGWFKKTLGVLFILIGIGIISGIDKDIERKISNSGLFDITKVEHSLLKLSESPNESAGLAPEIVKPSGFVNTNNQPITIGEFKDKKVVLLDVWTYSCINCQRTIPYLNAWYEKYKDYGLEIIGLHTPEFSFEKLQPNVQKAVEGFGIEYPVVLDNDYATWNAYGNQYWPRKYLIDGEGKIIYDHIGEGDYEKTEREIQKALMQLNASQGTGKIIPTDIVNLASVPAPSQKVSSPEIYFGAARNEYLANGVVQKTGEQNFVLPTKIDLNKVYLEGTWNIKIEEAQSTSKAKIVFKYNAKNVYMVASSQLANGTNASIIKDGVFQKNITIKENKLYTLIEGDDYGIHTLEIVVPDAGFEAFTFTFG